jgi:hypothetical protein
LQISPFTLTAATLALRRAPQQPRPSSHWLANTFRSLTLKPHRRHRPFFLNPLTRSILFTAKPTPPSHLGRAQVAPAVRHHTHTSTCSHLLLKTPTLPSTLTLGQQARHRRPLTELRPFSAAPNSGCPFFYCHLAALYLFPVISSLAIPAV